nr:hypothetical protein [Janthinobacterium sp. Marseille]
MNEKTDGPDLSGLVQALIAMRDSLVQTSLALQDLHYEISAEHLKLEAQVDERLPDTDKPSSLQ